MKVELQIFTVLQISFFWPVSSLAFWPVGLVFAQSKQEVNYLGFA